MNQMLIFLKNISLGIEHTYSSEFFMGQTTCELLFQ